MDQNRLIVVIRRWHEAGMQASLVSLTCPSGPPLAAMYLSVVEGVALPPAQAAHSQRCAVCERMIVQVSRHVTSLSAGLDGPQVTSSASAGEGRSEPASLARKFKIVPKQPARQPGVHRLRRWLVGGTLPLAASIAVVATILLRTPIPATADDGRIAAAARLMVFFPNSVDPFLDANPVEFNRRLNEIDQFRATRDALLERARRVADSEVRGQSLNFAMENWAQIYRRLRNIGRYADAFAEVEKARAACEVPEFRAYLRQWQFITLADLGYLRLAMGDYAGARQAFTDSIDARVVDLASSVDINLYPAGNRGYLANSLSPIYWAMALAYLAEGNVPDAREVFEKADRLWADHFRAICLKNGIAAVADATAWEALRSSPTEFQNPEVEHDAAQARAKYHGFVPTRSHVVHLRAHLYHQVILRRCAGDLNGARECLRRAATIPYFAECDEWRLPFSEALETARIAILSGDYAAALVEVSRAEANRSQVTAHTPGGSGKSQPPIASARLAELALLHGLALLGQDEKSAEGRGLIELALKVPDALGASLPAEQRTRFRVQFDAWRRLVENGTTASRVSQEEYGT